MGGQSDWMWLNHATAMTGGRLEGGVVALHEGAEEEVRRVVCRRGRVCGGIPGGKEGVV